MRVGLVIDHCLDHAATTPRTGASCDWVVSSPVAKKVLQEGALQRQRVFETHLQVEDVELRSRARTASRRRRSLPGGDPGRAPPARVARSPRRCWWPISTLPISGSLAPCVPMPPAELRQRPMLISAGSTPTCPSPAGFHEHIANKWALAARRRDRSTRCPHPGGETPRCRSPRGDAVRVPRQHDQGVAQQGVARERIGGSDARARPGTVPMTPSSARSPPATQIVEMLTTTIRK